MNLEKFTDRAKGFLQAAQTVAIRLNHQRISPAHLLKALLDDEQGMAAQLIQRAGGNPGVAITEVDNALAKVPAVSGGGAQQTPGLDNDAVRALDSAEQLAEKAGDAVARTARTYARLDFKQRADEVNAFFFSRFPSHPNVPRVVFRLGEDQGCRRR